MTRLMPLRMFLIGAVLIVITNAIALAGVAYNRSGEPDSTLHLTQRELHPPYRWMVENDENSGLSLRLDWRAPVELIPDCYTDRNYFERHSRVSSWLNKTKLPELGFDVSNSADTDDAAAHYMRMLPRDVFLVLELNGKAWQEALAQAQKSVADATAEQARDRTNKKYGEQLKNATKNLTEEQNNNSRLFAVDADLDSERLREKYPDRSRYAILRGQVRPQVVRESCTPPHLAGYITGVSTSVIHVPLPHRRILDPLLQGARNNFPRSKYPFSANVAFGKRFEPWVTGVAAGKAATD